MKDPPAHLIALDGTWSHARKLYVQNPWLHALPHYRIDPSAPSNYRIRREPSPSHLSTLESVLAALRSLEPETEGLDQEAIAKSIPLGKLGEPRHIADLTLFLLSHKADYITGQTIAVNGGMHIS